jgi:hypothetical protein
MTPVQAAREASLERNRKPTDYGECEKFGCNGHLIEKDRYRMHMDSIVLVRCNVCGYEREFT